MNDNMKEISTISTTWQVGDIIIFKAPVGDWVSQCIALLTDSDVSHSAMIYDTGTLLESGKESVAVSSITEGSGKTVHVLRLRNCPDPGPLLDTAAAYREGVIGYDYPGLVLLGILLVFRKIPVSNPVLALVRLLLPLAVKTLDEWIRKSVLHKTEETMICSELVYNIFYDAGEDYQIRFNHTILMPYRDRRDSTVSQGCQNPSLTAGDGMLRLADFLSDTNVSFLAAPELITGTTDRNTKVNQSFDGTPDKNKEMLLDEEAIQEAAKALWEALQKKWDAKEESDQTAWMYKDHVNNLLPILRDFAAKLDYVKNRLALAVPYDGLFITPADILLNSTNLDQIGITQLKYSEH